MTSDKDTPPKSAREALDHIAASGKVQAVGMAWFEEPDYPEILKIMADGNRLPRTYAEWYERSTKGEQELTAKVFKVLRAIVKPKDFVAWCRARGLKVDAKARTTFAAEDAARQIRM